MNPCRKVYYYTLDEIMDHVPFTKISLGSFLCQLFEQETVSDLISLYQVPSDLSSNNVYNEFWSLLYGRYYKKSFIKIEKWPTQADPDSEEISDAVYQWGYKFVSLLNMTYEYYVPLLSMYRDAKSHLMDDITATSKNKVKYNDTPQNANTSGVYEGDDYITQFTSTEGESTSPLTSKIMRLKDIQDHYKNVMADWVKEFEKLFFEVQ